MKQLLEEDFQGVLGSNFYGGSSIHHGLHQRCWVHFLRHVHELKDDFPDDQDLWRWANKVKTLSEQAVAWAEKGVDSTLPPRKQQQIRVAHQQACEQHVWTLCQPYVRTTALRHTLCKQVERFLPERFVFVAVPGVPAHNYLAKRSARPLVVARKISGSSCSPKGSATRMGLASLFGTWMTQHLNPFQPCLAMLTSPTSLG